jgi:hypothetical protein
MRVWNWIPALSVLMFSAAGCGDNLANPGSPSSVNPPRNITGLAVNGTTVRLRWQLPVGTVDSVVRSVHIAYNGRVDSVPRSTFVYDAISLTGPTEFQLSTYLVGGVHSSAVAFRWAPADRYDTAFVLTEYDPSDLTKLSGLHAGSGATNPRALTMELSGQSLMHVFLTGVGGQPLRLMSASRYVQGWNQTLFSTVTHAAVSLDYDLAAYPSDYVIDNVELADNTIYYARVLSALGQAHCVRFHVRVVPGKAYPDRQVVIGISLQRTADALFARHQEEASPETAPSPAAFLLPAGPGLTR